MKHEIHTVTRFERIGTYALRVEFEDGTAQEIDFEPVLVGGIFAPLRDPAVFNQVRLDPEAATLVWPTGADFDPATLYDWPNAVDELAARVGTWEPVSAVP
ncbi:MAG: DUF2442 domain-containing protein [Thermoanaerobaculia bacterium]